VFIDHASNGELRARVTLLNPEAREERVFYGHDCEALSDAVLLVISMAFEPDEAEIAWGPPEEPAREALALPQPAPQPRPPPAAPAPVAKTRLSFDESQRLPDRAPSMSVRIGPAIAFDRGSLPNTGFAGGGLVGVGLNRFQVSGGVSVFARQDGKLADMEGAHVDFRLITGDLRACYFLLGDAFTQARQRFAFGPCAALELGGLRGRGEGIPRAAEHTGWWAAGLFGVGVSLGPYGIIAPSASLALGLAMRRPKFEIEDAGTLYQAKPAFVRGSLGVMIELNP
jgi:hypothetical protein